MRSTTRLLQTLAIGGGLTVALLGIAPVSAQSIPIVLPPRPIVIVPFPSSILPNQGNVRHGGLWETSGGADVDFDRDFNTERGQVVMHD